MERIDRRRSFERALAGDHLVEHNAKREDVAPSIKRSTFCLLGRHVGDGSMDRALYSYDPLVLLGIVHRRHIRIREHGALLFDELRESEVQYLDLRRTRNHHIFWLDIAVNDTGFVRGRQARCGLRRQLDRPPRFDPAASEQVADSLSLDILHRDEVVSVVRRDLIDRYDVWMVKRGGRLRLLSKTQLCRIV